MAALNVLAAAALVLALASPASAQTPSTDFTTAAQSTTSDGQLRVAWIDMSYVAANSKQARAVVGEFEGLRAKREAELGERAKRLEAQQDELRRQNQVLAPDARLELERAFQKAQLDFARFREDTDSELAQFAARVERDLRARLFPVVDEISREKGLHLVFTSDAPGLLWFSPTLDLSRDVVQRLDRPVK